MATRSASPRTAGHHSSRSPSSEPTPPPQRYAEAFPRSTKVYLDGPSGIRVPMREIALSGGEPPLRVYDATGPQGGDVRLCGMQPQVAEVFRTSRFDQLFTAYTDREAGLAAFQHERRP